MIKLPLNEEKHERMVWHKKSAATRNKQMVYEAVQQLGMPSTSSEVFNQVTSIYKSDIEKKLKDLIERGAITIDEKEKYRTRFWKRRIVLRTVQRQLRILTDEGFLVYTSRRYVISGMEYPVAKIWAEDYGQTILFSAMKRIFPHYNRLEYNLTRLVEILGVYLIYSFIEAVRPITSSGKIISGENRDENIISWIENALQPRQMLYYFVTLLKTQLNDQDVRNTRRKLFEVKKGKFVFRGAIEGYILHLARLMVSNVRYPLKYKDKRDSGITESILESNAEMVDSIKKMLRKKYPTIYLQIEDAYNLFDVKNKEGIRSTGPNPKNSFEGDLDEMWSDLLEKIPILIKTSQDNNHQCLGHSS